VAIDVWRDFAASICVDVAPAINVEASTSRHPLPAPQPSCCRHNGLPLPNFDHKPRRLPPTLPFFLFHLFKVSDNHRPLTRRRGTTHSSCRGIILMATFHLHYVFKASYQILLFFYLVFLKLNSALILPYLNLHRSPNAEPKNSNRPAFLYKATYIYGPPPPRPLAPFSIHIYIYSEYQLLFWTCLSPPPLTLSLSLDFIRTIKIHIPIFSQRIFNLEIFRASK
jgi:hypothetical protein